MLNFVSLHVAPAESSHRSPESRLGMHGVPNTADAGSWLMSYIRPLALVTDDSFVLGGGATSSSSRGPLDHTSKELDPWRPVMQNFDVEA